MPSIANPIFPDNDQKIFLPQVSRLLQPRGNEGLRAASVTFPKVEVERLSDNSFQPIACVSVRHRIMDGIAHNCLVNIDALDRVSWWLTGLDPLGPGPASITPAQLDLEIRAATSYSDVRTVGLTNFLSFADRGLIVQVTGLLCSQWEMWARIIAAEPVGTKLRMQVVADVDRLGQSSSISYGQLAHAVGP